MVLLPYERVSFQSDASAPEVLRRLEVAVEPSKWRWTFSRNHKPFEGEIIGEGFKIKRIIHYRNSFLPVVVGRVRSDDGGVFVEATLRLHFFTVGFVAFWLVGVLLLGGGISLYRLSDGQNRFGGLFQVGMVFFFYLLVQGAFVFESTKAKRFLEQLAKPPAGIVA